MQPSNSPVVFMQALIAGMAPKLVMRLLKENESLAVYTGLWSAWTQPSVDGSSSVAAKVVLITVQKQPDTSAPQGPIEMDHLVPWVVFQTHSIDEESPVWKDVQRVLAEEFQTMTHDKTPSQKGRLQFDPSQGNHAVRSMAEPNRLAAYRLTQGSSGGDLPAPATVMDRKRVEYSIDNATGVRLFVEKYTTRQPLQKHMDADSGLVRTGTVLGAINEWHTILVVDAQQAPSPL